MDTVFNATGFSHSGGTSTLCLNGSGVTDLTLSVVQPDASRLGISDFCTHKKRVESHDVCFNRIQLS